MSNLLLEYIQKGHKEASEKNEVYIPKPVVTISREYGCPSADIAGKLCEELNHEFFNKKDNQWRWVNKEILEKSAHELNMKPEKIAYVFDNEHRSMMDEVLSAFSDKYYRSDRKIRKTIKEVVESIAYQGNVIIVGRGGVAITYTHPNALHVRLSAPINWRAAQIAQKYQMPEAEAKKRCLDYDKQRMALIEEFKGSPCDGSLFDLTVNCQRFPVEQATGVIIQVMKLRNMI